MKLPNDLSRAQKRFIRIFAKTGDHQKAALRAFPEKDSPVEYASKVLNDTAFRRSMIEYCCDKNGLSDESLIKQLAKGLESLRWTNPKHAATKLKIIEQLFKLKGRFPEETKKGTITINSHTNNVTLNAKEQVITEIWERAQKRMSEEQIETLIIDVDPEQRSLPPVNSKKELFTNEVDLNIMKKKDKDD